MFNDFDTQIQCEELEDISVLVEEYTDQVDYDDYWYDQNKHLMCPKCDFPHHFYQECVEN